MSAVLRFVARSGVDADTAADVVAETFYRALANRRRYRARNDTALPWLLGIARHVRADEHRSREAQLRRDRRLACEAIVLTQSDREDYERLVAEESDAALRALAELPEPQRVALSRRVLHNGAYREIASDLGLSEPATRQHVSRGLAVLRRRLGRNT